MTSPPSDSAPRPSTGLFNQLHWALWALTAAAALFLYTFHLGSGSLWNSDDAMYGHLVRQMIDSGSYGLAPSWFDYDVGKNYPLGMSWMALISTLSGTDEWGLRFPSLLAALIALGAWGLFWRPAPTNTPQHWPWLAALGLTASQPLFFSLSQRVMHDTLLMATIVMALGAYFQGHTAHTQTPNKSAWPWFMAAGLACGLASLVKIGAGLLPLTAIGLHLLLTQRQQLKTPPPWAAAAVALGIPASFLLLTGRMTTVLDELYQRFFVGLDGLGQNTGQAGAWNFFEVIFAQGLPGWLLTLLAIAGCALCIARRDPLDQLALCWTALAALMLAAMRTNLPHYTLQILMPMALLGGLTLARFAQLRPWLTPLSPVITLAMLGTIANAGPWVHHSHDRTAALANVQAQAAPETLLCTIDFYHLSPVFYTRRPVTYLTEDTRSRDVLRPFFGPQTVPTLQPGDIAKRLNQAPSFACLIPAERWPKYQPTLTKPHKVISPDPKLAGPEILLILSTPNAP